MLILFSFILYNQCFFIYSLTIFAAVTMNNVYHIPKPILGTTPLNNPAIPYSACIIFITPANDNASYPALALAYISILATSKG